MLPPPPIMVEPQAPRPPAVIVPQPRPPAFPHFMLRPRNPQVGPSPPAAPEALRRLSIFPHYPGTQQVPRPLPPPLGSDPVIPVENLLETPMSTNVTPNQAKITGLDQSKDSCEFWIERPHDQLSCQDV